MWTGWWQSALKVFEIFWMAPQVISQRVTRMMVAGLKPGARDRKEMTRMVSEKVSAFSLAGWQGWVTWWLELMRVPSGRAMRWQRVPAAMIAPVHRRVRQNRKRLLG
ncbi:hypothetical protein ACTSKR_14585 [Chitinibacteraceae bacterium HSL-7]